MLGMRRSPINHPADWREWFDGWREGPGVSPSGRVLAVTGCDGLMIGRAAYGNPWIFAELKAGLRGDKTFARPTLDQVVATMRKHVGGLHEFYGRKIGTRVARKHIGWYAEHLDDGKAFRHVFNRIETAPAQLAIINNYQTNPQGALAA